MPSRLPLFQEQALTTPTNVWFKSQCLPFQWAQNCKVASKQERESLVQDSTDKMLKNLDTRLPSLALGQVRDLPLLAAPSLALQDLDPMLCPQRLLTCQSTRCQAVLHRVVTCDYHSHLHTHDSHFLNKKMCCRQNQEDTLTKKRGVSS